MLSKHVPKARPSALLSRDGVEACRLRRWKLGVGLRRPSFTRAHIFEPRRTEPIWQVTKFCSRTHLHVQLQTAALRFIFPRPAGPPPSSPQSRLSALTRVRGPSHRLVPRPAPVPRQATVSGDSDTPLIGQHRDRRGTSTVHTASRRSPAPVLCQCDERERRDETRTREQPKSSRTHAPAARARARVVDSARAPVASRRADRTGGPTRCTAETPPGGAERARRAREPLSRAHVHSSELSPLPPSGASARFGSWGCPTFFLSAII